MEGIHRGGGLPNIAYSFSYIATAGIAVTALTTDTPAKVAGTTTLSLANDFTMPSNNRYLYTGTRTRICEISASMSCEINAAGTLVHFYVYKNDSPLAGLDIDRHLANSSDHGACSFAGLVSLSKGDYLEIWTEASGDSNLTVDHLSVVILSIT